MRRASFTFSRARNGSDGLSGFPSRGGRASPGSGSGARWVSGYTQEVDWLASMLLDLAVISELFLDFHHSGTTRRPPLHRKAQAFLSTYEQFARKLGFSGLVSNGGRTRKLVPERLRA